MKLTDHFTLAELSRSDTATRLGIDNDPPTVLLPNMATLALGLEQCRARLNHTPLHILSAYRCEELERVLCAKDYAAWCRRHGRHVGVESWAEYFARKAHPKGWAADFVCPAFGSPQAIVGALQDCGIRYDQLIGEGTWVHISFAPAMRGEVLSAQFINGQPAYTRLAA